LVGIGFLVAAFTTEAEGTHLYAVAAVWFSLVAIFGSQANKSQ
jgi:hypothetical protein